MVIRHFSVRHRFIDPAAAHVMGSIRRVGTRAAWASGHVLIGHRFIIPIVAHVVGAISGVLTGRGSQRGKLKAECGRCGIDFMFHEYCRFDVEVIEFNRSETIHVHSIDIDARPVGYAPHSPGKPGVSSRCLLLHRKSRPVYDYWAAVSQTSGKHCPASRPFVCI